MQNAVFGTHNPEVAGSSPVPATKKTTQMRGFFLLPVLWQAPPPRHRRGDFSCPAAGNCQTKKHTFFHGRGEGQHKHKNRTYKNNGAMMVIKHSISSALVFRTLGRNGALVFFAAFRRRLFHLYLFFHSNASPGFFIFPCFLQESAGGQSSV